MQTDQPVITNASVQAQDMYMRLMLSGVSGVASIITMPVEMWIRPFFGTMYFHPVTGALAWAVVQVLSLFAIAAQPTMRVVTGGPNAPIGMGVLYLLFWATCLAHAPRIWRRIRNMDLEDDAEDEGPAWSVFNRLPYPSWVVVRLAYEPLAVVAVALGAYGLGLIEPFVTVYFLIVAFALVLKNAIRWYEVWRLIRDIRNGQHRARILHLFAKGKASPATVGPFVTAAAIGASPALRTTIAASLSGGLTPDDAALLSPREPVAPGASPAAPSA